MKNRFNEKTFDSLYLASARTNAKSAGVQIPKNLSTFKHNLGNTPYYEVWASNPARIVWQGAAQSAYEARAKFIFDLISKSNVQGN